VEVVLPDGPAARGAIPSGWVYGFAWASASCRAEVLSELLGCAGAHFVFDLLVLSGPDGNGCGQYLHSVWGELQDLGASIRRLDFEAEKVAAGEDAGGCGDGGAVHAEQVCDAADGGAGDAGGIGAVEAHEHGELAVGEAGGFEGEIEAAGHGAGGALEVQAEAAISDEEGGTEWHERLRLLYSRKFNLGPG